MDTELQAALLFAFFSYTAMVVACKFHFFKWTPTYHTSLSPKVGIQGFLLFLAFQFLVLPFIAYSALSIQQGTLFIQPISLSEEMKGWINLFAILWIVVPFLIFAFLHRKEIFPLFQSKQPVKDIQIGFLTWFLAFPIMMFFSQIITWVLIHVFEVTLIDQTAVQQVKLSLQYPLLFAFTLIAVIFIVPVLEEFLFRGLLQTTLKQYIPLRYAIPITAFLFSLFHLASSQGINNLNIGVSLFILSLFLGFLRERQNNLLACTTLHMVFNACSILMIILTDE